MTIIGKPKKLTLLSLIPLITILLYLLSPACGLVAQEEAVGSIVIQREEVWTFSGVDIESENISGIAVRDNFVVIGSDEGADIQVLKKADSKTYEAKGSRVINLDKSDDEIDIEGIAWDKDYVYVIGSHARKRKTVDPDDTVQENRESLETVAIEPSRDQLFRLRLTKDGKLVKKSIEKISLRNIFADHPVLDLFQSIPGKENGLDIEALAVNKTGQLFIGFRSPVLRENFTPILVLTFDDNNFKENNLTHEIRYVNLDGRGIRGLAEIDDGFLILGGPVGNEPISPYLFFWNGNDAVPGQDNPDVSTHVKPLCQIPLPYADTQAEGIEFLDKNNGILRIVVVYDGVEDGGPTVFTCRL